jgi:hypothetical protein
MNLLTALHTAFPDDSISIRRQALTYERGGLKLEGIMVGAFERRRQRRCSSGESAVLVAEAVKV